MSVFKAEVGRKVYLVPTDYRDRKIKEFSEVVIWKVGRKWVEFAYTANSMHSVGRFDKAAFEDDGVSSVDAGSHSTREIAYADIAIYQRKKEQARLRERVRERFDAYNLSKIPLDKLLQIADILGIEHEVPADR